MRDHPETRRFRQLVVEKLPHHPGDLGAGQLHSHSDAKESHSILLREDGPAPFPFPAISMSDLASLRQHYARESLSEGDVAADPIAQFEKWFAQAQAAGLLEPNAMQLATSTNDGIPSVRTVLLKSVGSDGFTFYTDHRSQKGRELDANPHAALCFFWDVLQRQVRISGRATRVDRAVTEAYYRSRPHGSRVGAWASHQSQTLTSREALEAEVARLQAQHPEGTEVPLPPHWGGYAVAPARLEFWQGRPSRLHDRILYTKVDGAWTISRLSP
jgi:pyridoxamine 5'-phosphate oxidase